MSRLSHWIAALALIVILAGGISPGHADPDMWHELSLAREIVADRAVPFEDHFAYTPTLPICVHHEWGTGLILLGAVRMGEGTGVLIVGWSLAALIAWLGFVALRRSGASPPVMIVLAPIAIFLSWIGFSFVRAQMFSLVFLALLLVFLWDDRAGRRKWIWFWPFAHLLWLNLHAGFVVGMGLLGVQVVEMALRRRPVRHLLVLLGLEAALILVNPWGWHYGPYLARALTMARPEIGEWAPVTSAFLPIPMMWGFSIAIALYGFARRGWRETPGVLLVLLCAMVAGLHQRHLSIYALVWLAHVPGWVEQTPLGQSIRAAWEKRPRAATALSVLLLVGASAALAMNFSPRLAIPANRGEHRLLCYPAGAVDFMERTAFTGNVFVPFTVGAYLSYRLHPKVHVSLDGRYEVAYPPGSLERAHRIFRAEGDWERELLEHGTNAALVPAAKRLSQALSSNTAWRLAYRDDSYNFFVHTSDALTTEDRRGQHIAADFPDD